MVIMVQTVTLVGIPGREEMKSSKIRRIYEPAHKKSDLMVFQFVGLQMHMSSPLFGIQTCVCFASSFLKVSMT